MVTFSQTFLIGKMCLNGLKVCTYRFLGVLIIIQYVRMLCDKYFLSYDGFSEVPLTKNGKKHQFVQGEIVQKGLNICTYRFFGYADCYDHVRTLCDKYFLRHGSFFLILTGNSRYRVLKHGVGVEWEPRKTAA